MTLDEAIKHCEEVMMENLEKTKDRNASDPIAISCGECASDHHQLAEWLKELKAYREHNGDTISRQAAIDAIWNGINMDIYTREVKECLEALPSVTPLPCGDAISRQMVLAILKDKWNMFSDANDAMQESIDTIEAIPSGTSKQKTGRWIPTGYDGYADGNPVYDWWECSECGWEHTGDEDTLTAYCPRCGTKMEVMP